MKEFLKYIVVGGSAFIIDFAILFILNEYVFSLNYLWISVAIAYMSGLIYNYILSYSWVFANGKEKIKNKEVISFIKVFLIAIAGLFLTELLMSLFVHGLHFHYTYSKIIVSGIVMFWNYYGRKIFIFR